MPYEEILTNTAHDPGKCSEELLWSAFKGGDELAFTSIYNSYADLLYTHGCRYSADKEMVRDCLQDFFVYLRENRLRFANTTSIRLYLLRSFRRRVIEYLRKKQRLMYVQEPSEYAQFGVESSIESVYINNQVRTEQLRLLKKAMKALDHTERQAIYYFYFKGLGYEQIAEIFNFSHVSSARRVMYRSLKQLRGFFSYS